MTLLLIYIAVFALSFFVVRKLLRGAMQRRDFTSLKTVTFGDESAVRPDRWASVISVVTIFLLWGAFTGSHWVPIHAPGPFVGDTQFTYTLEAPDGARDDATVYARVFKVGEAVEEPEIEPGDGFAKNDAITVGAWRSELLLMDKNDEAKRSEGAKIVAIDGQPAGPGDTVKVADGEVAITSKGSLNFSPAKGMQMEPIWLPAPEAVVARVGEIASQGYQNFTLWEHLYWSLFRVIVGFFFGALVGIPLGYAMGLSDWFRGWFDPIVEFMRPVPPLALIPLVIIWAGIGESGKIILLFLAALWIMTISARAGVSGVAISKVHAAYSLGASKWQLMRHVIMPNSLPEIFTGARVAMGVCWGTVVAAELVAAEKGAGMMIMVASRFQLTDIVIMGIILIGIIGYGIDILMRKAEKWLVPWKGRV
ncbi:taurine transport system permease protein [Roseovarius halotolerans]|uniref:Putative aliphatic sulfonates transport permease protein SsuC n=1 Tax=Roseovarius halotolerans TaxID=505353 RepID=A0A1X6ZTK3_9RHOB|nr:ABC transporter permease subunit [Roseovarius halotolerans]RKT27801.1 taurine transport system permease protein [Roseovarius halotolerans]SLN61252.1 Putative aliphatic sulfonates transport permease protein SsuC [Roseovarius halotolerans]